MKYLLIILLIPVVSISIEITGAFGINFGMPLSKLKVVSETQTSNGELAYKVIPPKQIDAFSDYYVFVTPISKRVYSIWGVKTNISENECDITLRALEKKLKAKYKINNQKKDPAESLIEMMATAFDAVYLTKDNVRIIIQCDLDLSGYNLYIKYLNKLLEEEAEKEAVELKSKQIDDSAL